MESPMDSYSNYSLVNVAKRYDGLVDGTWMQNCTAVTEAEAFEMARATEKANSNKISVAVNHYMDGYMFWAGGQNFNFYKDLKEVAPKAGSHT